MTATDVRPSKAHPELVRPQDEDLDLFGITHPGKVRPDNQDHFLVCTIHPQVVIHATSLPDPDHLPLRGTRLGTMVLVADGVGGSAGGSEAARLAGEAVTRYVSTTLRCYHTVHGDDEEFLKALREAALTAHDAVRAEAATRSDRKPMATTLTMGFAVWPWLYVVQVGDSRCYHWDGQKLHLLTRDQTIAQMLVDQGALDKERMASSPLRHVLSSAIGGDEATPVVSRIAMKRPAGTLFCSDGLTKHVSDDDIADQFRKPTRMEEKCRALLQMALDRGGTDNITIAGGQAPLRG